MSVGPATFGVLVWGSVALVLAVFGYVVLAYLREVRAASGSGPGGG